MHLLNRNCIVGVDYRL